MILYMMSGIFTRTGDTEVPVDELHAALSANQFRLEYQPKVSLATNRIVGVEALLRWDHPSLGSLPARDFIAMAQLGGSILPIGEWVLRESCGQLSAWRQAFPDTHLQLAINVSTSQLHAGLADSILSNMSQQKFDARSVSLEITETTVMSDQLAKTVEILNDLKRLGFGISIDDFGTGYSTLEHLHQLPIDEVKIDSSFVAGLGIDRRATAIVASTISMAHAMQIDVVAEGVETLDQLEALRTLGCDFAQGYFIAPPMSASDISKLLANDMAGLRLVGSDDSRRGTIGARDAEAMLLELLEMTHQATAGSLPEAAQLTPRQVEILKRLLAGDRVPRIARDLYVSQSTVRNHLSLIYRRFAVHSQDELLHLLRVRRSERDHRYTPTALPAHI